MIAVLTVFLYGGRSVKNFFGYSYSSTLTTSMQGQLPKGSLVITKRVEPDSIELGNIITYLQSDNTTVTSRVISIAGDIYGKSTREFLVEETEEMTPNGNIVESPNVVGLMRFSIPIVGYIVYYMSNYLWVIYIIFGLSIAAYYSYKTYFKYNMVRYKEKQKEKQHEETELVPSEKL